jgi:hypothetical protein
MTGFDQTPGLLNGWENAIEQANHADNRASQTSRGD